MKSPSFLIVGTGHFGTRAALKLLEKNPHSRITVVDRDEKPLAKVSRFPVDTCVGDGTGFVLQSLSEHKPIDYIIPAVPFHLAFEVILTRLKSLGALRSPIPSLLGLPHPTLGKQGDLYTSLADFSCPEDCTEPSTFCIATGRKRIHPLFKILGDLKEPFHSFVIRSQQLGPGVGGYRPEVLTSLIETIKKRRGSNRPFLISTACRCHGVTSALSF